ncbi:MAG: hypothetical protein HRT95_05715 [Moritella sp.]|uniref:hypothetical protein n=1 Tax=Moritella sp. TaxID=78556 RepID=UPI001DCAFD44|nr:hypothetical protein [Moritella sp.]NQZ49688.1 hypothetical protein [Moritella sp.]
MTTDKHKAGNVVITKSTNGQFFIEIEHSNGDLVCQAILTAEQFAHAVTGKQVKAEITDLSLAASNRILELELQLNWLLSKVGVNENGVFLTSGNAQLNNDDSLVNLIKQIDSQ